MKKPFVKLLSSVMIATMFAGILTGCDATSTESKKKNKNSGNHGVFAGLEQRVIDVDVDLKSSLREKYSDFGFTLLKNTYDGKNQMISPFSLLSALAMVSNGSAEMTREEFETVFGMSVDEMNAYLYLLGETLPNDECQFNSANAIWVNEDKSIKLDKKYLQTVSDYFGPCINSESFGQSTVKDINSFVNDNTNKMIPKIIEELDPDSVMVLVNALAFEGEWNEQYEKSDVYSMNFNNLNDSKSLVDMMSSEESVYLDYEGGTGFTKDYKNGEYKFVALLPDEDIDFEDFVNDMTGEKFINIVTNAEHETVNAKIPKFTAEYTAELSPILKDMGLASAFNSQADFSAMTEDQHGMWINIVLHKTFIDVSEHGTKASAATVLEMKDECAAVMDETKFVILDRPFMYAIVDGENNTPIFIGMVTEL